MWCPCQVAISLEKNRLIDMGSTRENRQECGANRGVTLGEMKHFFALLIRELTHYQLFDVSRRNHLSRKNLCLNSWYLIIEANCWLFTSAIQHYLQQQTNARIVSGHLVKSRWAPKTRTRVIKALERLYNISTTPLVVSH